MDRLLLAVYSFNNSVLGEKFSGKYQRCLPSWAVKDLPEECQDDEEDEDVYEEDFDFNENEADNFFKTEKANILDKFLSKLKKNKV